MPTGTDTSPQITSSEVENQNLEHQFTVPMQTNLWKISVPEHRGQLRIFVDKKQLPTPIRMADMNFTIAEGRQLGNLLLKTCAKLEEENAQYKHTWIF